LQPQRPERIVLIVVDTLRQDALSCYGGSTPTPNIDALAAEGHLFPQAVASFHQTTMSMGAMFTGRTPSIESGQGNEVLKLNGRTWCGLARFAEAKGEEGCIPASLPTLPELPREAGYWTIGIASNPVLFRPSGFERGFDDWVEVGRQPPETTWQYFFNAEPRAAKHVNAAAARALSRRSQKLKEEGLYDGTVILFTSDHGERLKEQHLVVGRPQHLGNPSFEEVLRVPLIISPARFDDTSGLVRGQDIFRLIAAIAGAQPRVPQALEPGELFLTETGWRTYRKGRWKSFMGRGRDQIYLVDLAEDPGERRDVSSRYPSVVAEYRKRSSELAQQLAATHAPQSELSPEDRARLRALGYLE
jgi:arylsulfatase A-like enzyme